PLAFVIGFMHLPFCNTELKLNFHNVILLHVHSISLCHILTTVNRRSDSNVPHQSAVHRQMSSRLTH
ncbi:hypothetical protein, partial [Klebsiella pneumoniae]|uniref:hypothetical protein n=1 Tax=Klebsiella pneumoniae TaxID=573 RepID=UPI001C602C3C